MKRNPTVWVITAAMFLPFVWLVATSPGQTDLADIAMAAGALVTGLVLQGLLWSGHRQGRWVAHKCITCARPMRRILEGELRPPAGIAQEESPDWRCTHCGRLH